MLAVGNAARCNPPAQCVDGLVDEYGRRSASECASLRHCPLHDPLSFSRLLSPAIYTEYRLTGVFTEQATPLSPGLAPPRLRCRRKKDEEMKSRLCCFAACSCSCSCGCFGGLLLVRSVGGGNPCSSGAASLRRQSSRCRAMRADDPLTLQWLHECCPTPTPYAGTFPSFSWSCLSAAISPSVDALLFRWRIFDVRALRGRRRTAMGPASFGPKKRGGKTVRFSTLLQYASVLWSFALQACRCGYIVGALSKPLFLCLCCLSRRRCCGKAVGCLASTGSSLAGTASAR